MEFSKIQKGIDSQTVDLCNEAVNYIYGSMAMNPLEANGHDSWGGDPFFYQLMCPTVHVLTRSIATAATDGRNYFWNPEFLLSLNFVARRVVQMHEGVHDLYDHTERRGSRNPMLWNQCIDYVSNKWICDDVVSRNKAISKYPYKKPEDVFNKIGGMITLPDFVAQIKDPFRHLNAEDYIRNMMSKRKMTMPSVYDDRELTAEERAEIKRRQAGRSKFYVDPNLPEKMKRPEDIYAYLESLMPRCKKCGRLGVYKMPEAVFRALDAEAKKQAGKSFEDLYLEVEGKPFNTKSSVARDLKKVEVTSFMCEMMKDDTDETDETPSITPVATSTVAKSSLRKPRKKVEKEPELGKSCCEDDDEKKLRSPGDQQTESGDGIIVGSGGSGSKSDQGQSASGNTSNDKNEHGCGDCDCGEGACDECGGFDFFNMNSSPDDHIPHQSKEEDVIKRFSDARRFASITAGSVPAGLEDELGRLTKPVITWQDFIRDKSRKINETGTKSNWNEFKNRLIPLGIFMPKKVRYVLKIGVCLDTSGSMSNENIAYVTSQVTGLGLNATGAIVPADGAVFWDKATYLNNFSRNEVQNKTTIVGRGGTNFVQDFVSNYRDHIGDVDLLIFATDGYLFENLEDIKPPKVKQIVWLVSGDANFKVPRGWGRVFNLHNDRE
jgi:predicted metal-dependent peptidase